MKLKNLNIVGLFTAGIMLCTNIIAQKSKNVLSQQPNIVFILMDNLGYGEVGCYGGGILRGVPTPRIDRLATDGLKLLNFNTEPICTPCRSALLTGRHPIRSGTYKVATNNPYGLVQWERTTAELLSEKGYATALFGKWHLGNTDGRFPTDQGFDEYYGIPNTSNEAFPAQHKYDPKEGYFKSILESKKGGKVHVVKEYNEETRREIDNEITEKTIAFIERNVKAKKPFYAYVPFTQVHFPTIPSRKFEGKTGNGDWADVLSQIDYNVGLLIDVVDRLNIRNNTIFIFTSDNGAEDIYPWRGWAGPWSGTYNTAMEGSLRTPFIIRWPGKVPANTVSNEIVHVVDLFTTLAKFAGAEIPTDRPIDGIDQSAFFLGKQSNSNRLGFPIYYGPDLYAVKYKNWKVHYIWKKYRSDSAIKLQEPRVFNLYTNPQERYEATTFNLLSRVAPDEAKEFESTNKRNDSLILIEASKIINSFQQSFVKYPNIPIFMPDPYIPSFKSK